jgi:hypothetical protein
MKGVYSSISLNIVHEDQKNNHTLTQSEIRHPLLVVVRKVDDLVYLVKKTQQQQSKAIYIDNLNTYRGRNVPTWIDRLCKRMGK